MSQVIPIYIPTYISDQNYNPTRVLPRLFFYNGLVDCETYWIESGSLTNSGVTYAQNHFPYFDNYNVVTGSFPTIDSDSLLFNNEAAAYGEIPVSNLYTKYWETYVSLLYNPRTRLFNCEAIIPLADYYKMELNDIVEWRGNYYHLRAINDYNLKNGECKIQLLGPLEPPVISNLLPVYDCGFGFTSSVIDTQLFTFQISSSLDIPLTINNRLLVNLSGSAINIGGTESLPSDEDTAFRATSSFSDTAPFLLYTDLLSGTSSIGETLGTASYYDIILTDVYDNGLPALSSSYLGNGSEWRKQPVDWNVLGYWSSSLWSSLNRTVEVQLSVNRDLVLYDMSGSNGFSSYNLAKPYLYSSGSIATTIGIPPVSQSIMQNGWGKVPAFNTDYTTRYQANIPARRFYIAEFNNNREIIRFEPDAYNTLSNISVQRLDKKITQPILRKANNNIGGLPTIAAGCFGSGSSSGDLYYNFESSSFFSREQAVSFFNLTYSFNYYGSEMYLNSGLTTPYINYGAFVDTTNLEFMQGNLTPASDGFPFVIYQSNIGFVIIPQNSLGNQLNCP
jgi:hypothetical protein